MSGLTLRKKFSWKCNVSNFLMWRVRLESSQKEHCPLKLPFENILIISSLSVGHFFV